MRTKKSKRYSNQFYKNLYVKNRFKNKIYREIKHVKADEKKEYLYSGIASLIYPQLIENITGISYQSYIQENFYKPLGCMTLDYLPMHKNLKNNIVPTELDTIVRKDLTKNWVHDENYHVRRLVSEGTRPSLPWSQKIVYTKEETIVFLNSLYNDSTRYVVRSVANHLNDISKTSPNFVINTLQKWQKEESSYSPEIEYLNNHALRTLIRGGNKKALIFLGYQYPPFVAIEEFSLNTNHVKIGGFFEFSLCFESKSDQSLIIDYIIHFKTKRNEFSQKVFRVKKGVFSKGEMVSLKKKHSFKKISTRTYYAGTHKIEIQINGVIYKSLDFEVLA